MSKIAVKFFAILIPTCAVSLGGIWLAHHQSGFWSAVGWTLAAVFSTAAVLQLSILISGLALGRFRHDAEQRLEKLERRDAELFAQGKSFDEIMSQYKKPLPPRTRHAEGYSFLSSVSAFRFSLAVR